MNMAGTIFRLCTTKAIVDFPRNSFFCFEVGKIPKCHGFIVPWDTSSGFAMMIRPGPMKQLD